MIHTPLRLYEIEKKAEEFDVPLRYAVNQRLRYLWGRFGMVVNSNLPMWFVWFQVWSILDDVVKLQRDMVRKNKPVRKGDVTEDMKRQAKAFPIERLIEFDRQGKACCFQHQEKTPSLNLNKARNKAHCFGGCGKSFDPIDVLVIRDGKNYFDAVRELCER